MKKNDLSLLWSLFSFFRGDLLFGSISVYTEVETKRERFIGGKGGGDGGENGGEEEEEGFF